LLNDTYQMIHIKREWPLPLTCQYEANMNMGKRDKISGKTKILDTIFRSGLEFPKTVTLAITNNCNLNCHHCLPGSSFHGKGPVPPKEISRLITGFILLGVEEICLTGGEPLMHPDWLEILSDACSRQGLKRVRLQTNGILLTGIDIEALGSMDSERLILQVSLEGSKAKTNDRVRGSGSFEKIMGRLKLLAGAGLGRQVVVAFTEMHHNFSELPALLELLDQLGIKGLVSGTIVSKGRAVQTKTLAPPTPLQYRELLDLYHLDPQFRSIYKRIGNIAALEWFKGKSSPGAGCCNCIEKLYIDANGNMYPCPMLPIKKLAVKNVYQRPLEESLSDGVALWAELPLLHHRRSVELKICQDCPGRKHCAGGCMGRAYTSTGGFINVEDRCQLRKEVYSWKSEIG
jgi:radical SAM protein with 4Fe4S-binding SPASM domain